MERKASLGTKLVGGFFNRLGVKGHSMELFAPPLCTHGRREMKKMATVALAAAVECGSLLCQRDSFARSLSAVVVSCGATAGAERAHGSYALQLSDTVLFPEGGGQVGRRWLFPGCADCVVS